MSKCILRMEMIDENQVTKILSTIDFLVIYVYKV